MNVEKAYLELSGQRIFYAVLNWGLGHATRSAAVIKALLQRDNEIIIASDGLALDYLQDAFPNCDTLVLPGYDVRYDSKSMVWNMLRQSSKIWRAIRQEHRVCNEYLKAQHLDMVISDSRFGCHHPAVKSIIITHQINLQLSQKWMMSLANSINHRWLRAFDEIWVPDYASQILSGALSDARAFDVVKYIGPISHLRQAKKNKNKYDLAVIISGPEPDRTRFEDAILKKIEHSRYRVWLARGTKSGRMLNMDSPHIKIVDLADANAIADAMSNASKVLCRSGYSSIMDLAVMNKPAIMVPTAGQPEQIYLEEYLTQNPYGWQFYPDVDSIDLDVLL